MYWYISIYLTIFVDVKFSYTLLMKKSSLTKALLLSALVFPGAGQIHLKRFKTGFVLITIIIVCLFVMITLVMNTAMSAMQQIQMQGGIVNMTDISRIATETTEKASNFGYSFSLTMIVVCWLYSIIDVVIACRKTPAAKN